MEKDVGVYMIEHTLVHKLQIIGDPEMEVFWKLNYRDKVGRSLEEAICVGDVVEPRRLWVAITNGWAGYFEIKYVEGNELILGGWKAYHGKNKERMPFQGYTYKTPKDGA